MVVDSSEIINTLRGGGISSVGYAISEAIPVAKGGGKPSSKKDSNGGLLSSILGKKEKKAEPHVDIASGEDKSAKIIGLVRRAMLGRLTLPCDYSTAERALVLVAALKSPRAGLKRTLRVLRSAVVIIRWIVGMWRPLFCLRVLVRPLVFAN